MMLTGFRKRLQSGERLLGTMVTLPTASAAEILADAGFDWLFIDAEHGPLSTSELLAVLQAVSHRIACLVRVSSCSESEIKRVLDLGAQGIIVPQVNSAEQAADVVRFARYAPAGSRGVGLARAHGYGFRFSDYVNTANSEIVIVIQAEHRQAVDNMESIVNVGGIDAVLLGPYDLSASYGKMGEISDPVVLGAIDRITEVTQRAGLPLGYFGITADAVRPWADRGFTLLVAGVDVLFLGNGARRMLRDLSGPA